MTARYGQRNVAKMIREWDALRKAIRAEGTPAIQDALDKIEPHIDYAYRAGDVWLAARAEAAEARVKELEARRAPEVAALVEALLRARDWIHAGGDRPGPILRQIDAAIAGMEGRG
jgi:hypothetical protein